MKNSKLKAQNSNLLTSTILLFTFHFLLFTPPSWASVADTKHNLSVSGPGPIKAPSTSDICVFCHTPHDSRPSTPIWNKDEPGTNYDTYASPTIIATIGQPDGSSKLCLACHDGAMAVGSILNMPGVEGAGIIPVTGDGITTEGKISPASTAFIGTDLRDDHPISFLYSDSYPYNPEIVDPSTLTGPVKLDSAGKIQCSSCHDPHDDTNPKFLHIPFGTGSPLCTACHNKLYWDTMPSIHRDSLTTWNGLGQNPWHIDLGNPGYNDDTPQFHGCFSCHRSHSGAGGMMLLKGVDPLDSTKRAEEWTCIPCHNGNMASNIETMFSKFSRHPVKENYGLHTPSRYPLASDPVRENLNNLPTNLRHSECQDCHNPHASKVGLHTQGDNVIGNTLLGSWGVQPIWGAVGSPATSYNIIDFTDTGPNKLEGYLCLKCHSYYSYGLSPPTVPSGNADGSVVEQADPTIDFNPGNLSFHPVFETGKNLPPATANPNWPNNGLGLTNTFMYVLDSVRYPVKHDSRIACSDCHGSSDVNDPKGPHGSDQRWILKGNETGIGTPQNFCYNCHRRDVYGDEGYVGPYANYSRVPHPVDGLGINSPPYQSGPNLGNNSNKWGILCLTCHGGEVTGGIHGTDTGFGTGGGIDEMGERMMNGASLTGITRATTISEVRLWVKNVQDAVNNWNTGINSCYDDCPGVAATYDY